MRLVGNKQPRIFAALALELEKDFYEVVGKQIQAFDEHGNEYVVIVPDRKGQFEVIPKPRAYLTTDRDLYINFSSVVGRQISTFDNDGNKVVVVLPNEEGELKMSRRPAQEIRGATLAWSA